MYLCVCIWNKRKVLVHSKNFFSNLWRQYTCKSSAKRLKQRALCTCSTHFYAANIWASSVPYDQILFLLQNILSCFEVMRAGVIAIDRPTLQVLLIAMIVILLSCGNFSMDVCKHRRGFDSKPEFFRPFVYPRVTRATYHTSTFSSAQSSLIVCTVLVGYLQFRIF